MGRAVVTNADYEKKIKTHQWADLQTLHAAIVARATPDWAAGKALEYLIVRAFELDGARVRWPYDTEIDGEVVEQIDGAIVASGLHCLIECKDESKPLAIAPVAKMRNQLQRRPPATVGLNFSTSGYTNPAQILAGYLGSQTILLWHPEEIELAVTKNRIIPLLEAKYRACVETGLHVANTTVMGIL
jgi:hypothetical protein